MAVPTAPLTVVASAGNGSATVSWTAPTSDGGSAIVGYLITPSLEDGTELVEVLACGAPIPTKIMGLADGTRYRFTVKAFNADGTGTESAYSNIVKVGLNPTIPAGYSRAWVTDFSVPNGRVVDSSGNVLQSSFKSAMATIPASHHGSTRSINISSNFIVAGDGQATFRSTAGPSGNTTHPYTSAYQKSVSSFFQPLTGRYEALLRFPMGHSIWPCLWFDAGGSSDRFEVDAAEMFLCQTPGRASIVFHSAGHYSENMNGSASWDSAFTYHRPSGGSEPFQGPDTGSTRYGKKAHDWSSSLIPNARPWVKVAMEVDKITGAAGYTVRIRIYWDDVLMITYVDPFNPETGSGTDKNGTYSGNKPRWVQSWLSAGGTEDRFWDIRFDTWVGGNYIGKAMSSPTGGSQTMVYDGTLGNGSAGYTPGALVPSAAYRWPHDMDVRYVQRLTKNP